MQNDLKENIFTTIFYSRSRYKGNNKDVADSSNRLQLEFYKLHNILSDYNFRASVEKIYRV